MMLSAGSALRNLTPILLVVECSRIGWHRSLLSLERGHSVWSARDKWTSKGKKNMLINRGYAWQLRTIIEHSDCTT